MELKTVSEMKKFLEAKFSSEEFTVTVQPVSQARKNPDFTVFSCEWKDREGNPRPEFNGNVRQYKNGLTSVA